MATPLVSASAARVKTGAVHWVTLHIDPKRSMATLLLISGATNRNNITPRPPCAG